MSPYIQNREEITKQVLSQINPEYKLDDLRNAMSTWWVNIRDSGGLGLTERGNECFMEANLERYAFKIDKPTPSLAVYAVEIDRKFPSPYHLKYIKRDRYIIVYDTRIATMVQLYGSVSEYVNSLERIYG